MGVTPFERLGVVPAQQPQRQDALLDQLEDLHVLAARYGMYDAADWLWKMALNEDGKRDALRSQIRP